MAEPWIVFLYQGKEVCAFTVHGTFPGEIDATKDLLAREYGYNREDIKTELAVR